jgi:hypothetical protein
MKPKEEEEKQAGNTRTYDINNLFLLQARNTDRRIIMSPWKRVYKERGITSFHRNQGVKKRSKPNCCRRQ